MGLCFVEPGGGRGKSGFRRWLQEYLEPEPGNIIVGPSRIYPLKQEGGVQSPAVPEGTIAGEHKGLWHATIGERSHLEFPQGDPRFAGKWYISRKDEEHNTIEVVKGLDNARLFGKGMVMEQWRWLGEDAEAVALGKSSDSLTSTTCDAIWESGLVAQFRHRQKPLRVMKVEIPEKSTSSNPSAEKQLRILLENPVRSITPGQSAALWFCERCLGGGVIKDIVDLD